MGALEQYWTGIGQWLQIQAESFNSLISHQGEKGRANELTVAEFLGRLLPPNLGIGSGLIIGADGSQSRQCDMIVHDIHKHPQLFSQTTQFVHPAETVVMTVEVKTTLDAEEVQRIGRNTTSVRSSRPASKDAPAPLVCVFAFSTSASATTTLKWFENLSPESRPDLVCVVNPGLVLVSAGEIMQCHCVLLHETTELGERLSKSWISPASPGSAALVGGSTYPVAKVKSTEIDGMRVFDPGRALLLFSVKALSGLGDRGQLGSSWWEEYLDSTTRETVEVGTGATADARG
ncbi:DUF6602 domain-containing protein [Diaminobutyricimonas sp. LJ205]|uniref:DUF6602 domain-containing protein n=1 Tax=Diaminobutyricimonas sp. LJ205 TaxID=2683590 RepID=UPI0012F48AA3|nr:DUF6602 domain-containing protein [Diaminobutyricimonas sp. LJ205]